jgi:subtilase family serine protease
MVLVAAVGVLALIPAIGASAGARQAASVPTDHARRVCPVSTSPIYAECMSWVATTAKGVPLTSLTAPPGYGPGKFHAAYAVPTTTPASAHQTIAIVGAYNNKYLYADLQVFIAQYRLPPLPKCERRSQLHCFVKVNQQGHKTPLPPGDVGWGMEAALDVQTAYGMCQNCRIEVVEASTASFTDFTHAVNTAVARGADVVSNSYGSYGYDCAVPGYDHPQVAIVVSSGDAGFGIACPAVMNTTVSVGGTTLNLKGDNTYLSEQVWNGSGSGCSSISLAQAWQVANANWAAIGCGSDRGMNDVSADADPQTGAAIYDSYGMPGWIQLGGTSLSAPLIAGVYALAGNSATYNYPAQTVYASPSSLHDVTTGSNGTCSPAFPLRCQAGSGYDLPTGMGSPNGLGGF